MALDVLGWQKMSSEKLLNKKGFLKILSHSLKNSLKIPLKIPYFFYSTLNFGKLKQAPVLLLTFFSSECKFLSVKCIMCKGKSIMNCEVLRYGCEVVAT